MKGVWKFVGGCFVGAASAVVMSPKSGSELRRQMALRLAHGLERAAGEAPSPAARGTRAAPERPIERAAVGAPVGAKAPRAERATTIEEAPAVAHEPVAEPSAGAAIPSVGRPAEELPPVIEVPTVAFDVAATESSEAVAPMVVEEAAPMVVAEPETVAEEEPEEVPEPEPAMEEEPEEVPEPEPAIEEIPEPEAEEPDLVAGPQVEPEPELAEEPPIEPEPDLAEERRPFGAPPVWTYEDVSPPAPEPAADLTDEWRPVAEPVRPESAALAAAAQSAAAVGPPAAAESPSLTPEEQDAAAEAGIADLRARIEQTKAAVRQALEHPFVTEESVAPPLTEDGVAQEAPVAEEESVVEALPNTADAEAIVTAGEAITVTGEMPPIVEEPPVEEASTIGTPVEPPVETPEQPPPEILGEPPSGTAPESGPSAVDVAEASVWEPRIEEVVPVPPVSPAFVEGTHDHVGAPRDAGELEAVGTAEGVGMYEPAEQPVGGGAREGVDADFDAFRAAFSEGDDAGLWVPPEPVAEPVAEPTVAAELAPSVAESPAPPAQPVGAEEEAAESSEESVVDQAEMRRRIEETRSRLKAKAFDAMASGESALLGREVAEQTSPVDVDEPLDDDVRAVIDKSLSQDDY